MNALTLIPDRARRVAAIANRLTKPDCWRCGGEDFFHSASCSRRTAFLSTRIAFERAAIKAAAKHERGVKVKGIIEELRGHLRAAIAEGRA